MLTRHVPKLYGDEAVVYLSFVFYDAHAVGGAVGGVEDVGFLGEVVDHSGLAAGFGADDQDLELGEVVHCSNLNIGHKWAPSFLSRLLALGLRLALYLQVDGGSDLVPAFLAGLLVGRLLYFFWGSGLGEVEAVA